MIYQESFENCPKDSSSYLTLIDDLRENMSNIQEKTQIELEICCRHVLSCVVKTLEQIYAENVALFTSEADPTALKGNFKGSLLLLDISREVLESVIQRGAFTLDEIKSVPVNVPHIILITFQHCKISEEYCKMCPQSVAEILELFKKTQELHERFLEFLDNNIHVKNYNEDDLCTYQEMVVCLLKISDALVGVNMKSMVNNWKCLITFIQKLSEPSCWGHNLSKTVQTLCEKINKNLLTVYKDKCMDEKSACQTIKITGFLIKVAIKLVVNKLNTNENYQDIIKFWLMIYEWNIGFFQTNNFPKEIIDAVDALLTLCSQTFLNFLNDDCNFAKFCLSFSKQQLPEYEVAYLQLINVVLGHMPNLLQEQPKQFVNCNIVNTLEIIFTLVPKCNNLLFNDYNSRFYDSLITNVTVSVLLFSDDFPKVEKLFLKGVLSGNIWLSLIATDAWSLILRNASTNVCQQTLNNLLKEIDTLNGSNCFEATCKIRLKVLSNRIFQILPDYVKVETLTKHNPSHKIATWKILKLKNIPPSHRYHIEFMIHHLLEKVEVLNEADVSVADVLNVVEILNVLSYTDLTDLELKASRLVPIIMRLWKFDETEVSYNNIYFKPYLTTLIKISTSIFHEFSENDILQILTKMNFFYFGFCDKFLVCDLLNQLPKLKKGSNIVPVVCDIFQKLLKDKNPIIIQKVIEGISSFSCGNIIDNLKDFPELKRMVLNFNNKTATKSKYTEKYFGGVQESCCKHQHQQSSTSEEPNGKRIKLDLPLNAVDSVLNRLVKESNSLLANNRRNLNEDQKDLVRNVINKLEALIS